MAFCKHQVAHNIVLRLAEGAPYCDLPLYTARKRLPLHMVAAPFQAEAKNCDMMI